MVTSKEKIAAWERKLLAESDGFSNLLPNRAALWSGWRSASDPRKIAKGFGFTTLEATPVGQKLDSGVFKAQLDADFGADWNEDKRAVWMMLSKRFAAAVRGDLVVLLNSERYGGGETILAKADPASIVFSEIMETDFGDPRKFNPHVTNIYIWVVRGPQVVNSTMLFSAPLQ